MEAKTVARYNSGLRQLHSTEVTMTMPGQAPSEFRSDVGSPVPILRRFLTHLRVDAQLSEHTVYAYRRDLDDFLRFLTPRRVGLATFGQANLNDYLSEQRGTGKSPRTCRRRFYAVSRFIKHRTSIGQPLDIDPRLIPLPPIASTPRVALSPPQVDTLIAAPNSRSMLFARDVAMLELLYRSGLQATELCDLRLRDVRLQADGGEIAGTRRGVISLAPSARGAIDRYLRACRPRLNKARADRLFLSRTGKPMERVGLWMMVEKYGRASGLTVSPRTLRRGCAAVK